MNCKWYCFDKLANSFDFQPGTILPLRKHLATSRNISGFHDCAEAIVVQWEKARDASKYPVMPRRAPHNKELSSQNVHETEKP